MMLRTLTSILSCKMFIDVVRNIWSLLKKKKKNTGILPAPPWQQDQPPALQASDKSSLASLWKARTSRCGAEPDIQP